MCQFLKNNIIVIKNILPMLAQGVRLLSVQLTAGQGYCVLFVIAGEGCPVHECAHMMTVGLAATALCGMGRFFCAVLAGVGG